MALETCVPPSESCVVIEAVTQPLGSGIVTLGQLT